MSTPYLGQLLLVSWNRTTNGYMMCNGQLLPVNQNVALFSLLGTTFGGDGVVNFGLPNLQAARRWASALISSGGSGAASTPAGGGAHPHSRAAGRLRREPHQARRSAGGRRRRKPIYRGIQSVADECGHHLG